MTFFTLKNTLILALLNATPGSLMRRSKTAVSKNFLCANAGQIVSTTADVEQHFTRPAYKGSQICVVTTIINSQMLPPLFSLTNGKSFILPQDTKLYNSHNFTSSSNKVYIQSVQVLTLQTSLYAAVFYFHVKAISLLETVGLPGGMSTLEASVKPQHY